MTELLKLEKQTSQSLELSLKRERNLSVQFQSRVTSLQRTVDDLQQRLRVGKKGRIDVQTESSEKEALQKQLEESEKLEQSTYRELEEKRKAYDTLLVEQLNDRTIRERLQAEVGMRRRVESRLRRRNRK